MEVNEYILKIKGDGIAIESPLELDVDVELVVQGTVVKREEVDNNDGTMNVVFLVKGIISSKLEP